MMHGTQQARPEVGCILAVFPQACVLLSWISKLAWESPTRTVSTLNDCGQGSMGACGHNSGRVCLRNLEKVRA